MIVGIGLLFTVLFHIYTPEVKVRPTQRSSSLFYERLKPERRRINPNIEINEAAEILEDNDSRYADCSAKPSSSYMGAGDTCDHADCQIEAAAEEVHDDPVGHRIGKGDDSERKKMSLCDWLKEPQFYQVRGHVGRNGFESLALNESNLSMLAKTVGLGSQLFCAGTKKMSLLVELICLVRTKSASRVWAESDQELKVSCSGCFPSRLH